MTADLERTHALGAAIAAPLDLMSGQRSRSRIRPLLAARLGEKADRYDLIGMAAAVRDEIGEITSLDQADPESLEGIIARHRRKPARYPTSTAHEELLHAAEDEDELT